MNSQISTSVLFLLFTISTLSYLGCSDSKSENMDQYIIDQRSPELKAELKEREKSIADLRALDAPLESPYTDRNAPVLNLINAILKGRKEQAQTSFIVNQDQFISTYWIHHSDLYTLDPGRNFEKAFFVHDLFQQRHLESLIEEYKNQGWEVKGIEWESTRKFGNVLLHRVKYVELTNGSDIEYFTSIRTVLENHGKFKVVSLARD